MNAQPFSLPGLELCTLPAGQVTIIHTTYIERGPRAGEVYDTELPVEVSPCLISRYPITNDQYQVFVDDPDGYANRGWWRFHVGAIESRRVAPYPPHYPLSDAPRTNVSWWDARAFCRWLSAKTGQTISLPKEEAWVLAAQTPPSEFERPDPTLWEWCSEDKYQLLLDHTPTFCYRKDVATYREMVGLGNHSNLGFRVCQVDPPPRQPSVTELLDRLDHEDHFPAQHRVLVQLAQIGSVECVPFLMAQAQDPDQTVRFWALRYLGLFGDMRGFDTLIQALDQPDSVIQRAAAEALGYMGELRAVPALIRALHSEDLQLRGTVMAALLQIDLQVFEILLDLAQNEPNADIRKQVIWALTHFRHTPAIKQNQSRLETIVNTTEDQDLRAEVVCCLDSLHTPFVNPHGFADDIIP